MIVRSMPCVVFALLASAPTLAIPMAARAQDLSGHCAAVRNDDRVKPIPTALVPEARQALGVAPVEPDAAFQAGAVFRCMGGKVWLCNHGANLTCGKGDVRRVSVGATAWCRAHPGSDVVPMAATGHATIYAWTCVGREPHITQAQKLDPRGFIADQWTPFRN